MTRVFLIHWNAAELPAREAALRALGCAVDSWCAPGGVAADGLEAKPPDAVVIDLGRLPSHGRELAQWMRGHKATRRVPLVFVGGDPDKVERARAQFPDAVYATWRGIGGAVRKALARPPADPVVPQRDAGYSGTPLPKKLGIRDGSRVVLLGAPRDFARTTLGALPDGATLHTRLGRAADVIVLFAQQSEAIERRLRAAVQALAAKGGLWIAWPKQASGVPTDLSDEQVRALGLASGLVDNKVCAIDATWSGLRFMRRQGSARKT